MAENIKKKRKCILDKLTGWAEELFKKLDKTEEEIMGKLGDIKDNGKGSEEEKNFLRDVKDFIKPTMDLSIITITVGCFSIFFVVLLAYHSASITSQLLQAFVTTILLMGTIIILFSFIRAASGALEKQRKFKKLWWEAYKKVYGI